MNARTQQESVGLPEAVGAPHPWPLAPPARPGSDQAMGPDRHAPRTPQANQARPSDNRTNQAQAQEQQKLDGPLHMRSLSRTIRGAGSESSSSSLDEKPAPLGR